MRVENLKRDVWPCSCDLKGHVFGSLFAGNVDLKVSVSKHSHMSDHRLAMRTWSCANESCSMVNAQILNVYDEDLFQSSKSECDSWLAVVSPREGLLGWNEPEYLKTMAKIVFLLTSWRGFVKRTKLRKCVERWDRNDLSLGIEIIIEKRLFSLKT